MTWENLADWWLAELSDDPAYETVVTPMLRRTFDPTPGDTYVDLGAGEGRISRLLESAGATVVPVDVSRELLSRVPDRAVVARLPQIPLRDDSVDGCVSVLVLEHIEDHGSFFAETARVTKVGGALAVVLNHPFWTAPESSPVTDDWGEVLWRPGEYFSTGSSDLPSGDVEVTFHHRSMSDLLNAATSSGWSLQYVEELPHHELVDQAGLPRLMSCRWRLLP